MTRIMVLEFENEGDVWRMRRAARAMGVRELARKAGVSENAVYLIEHGKMSPSPAFVAKLKKALADG